MSIPSAAGSELQIKRIGFELLSLDSFEVLLNSQRSTKYESTGAWNVALFHCGWIL